MIEEDRGNWRRLEKAREGYRRQEEDRGGVQRRPEQARAGQSSLLPPGGADVRAPNLN